MYIFCILFKNQLNFRLSKSINICLIVLLLWYLQVRAFEGRMPQGMGVQVPPEQFFFYPQNLPDPLACLPVALK
jgi:hypothetical protein